MRNLFDYSGSATAGDIERLLKGGAQVYVKNDKGHTSFMMAICTGYNSAAEALFKAGADINTQDSRGNTSLMIAAYAGMSGAIEHLINLEADMTLTDESGATALRAVTDNLALDVATQTKVIMQLLDAGAIPNIVDLAAPLVANLYNKYTS